MTNQPPQQTVVVRFIANTQEAITRAKAFRDEVNNIKTQMMSAAQQSGRSFKDLAVAMQAAARVDYSRQIEQQRQLAANNSWNAGQLRAKLAPIQAQARQTSQAINTAFSELTAGAKGATSGIGVLGNAIGTALGISAVAIIGKLIGLVGELSKQLSEAAVSGYEFAKGLFQISIGINALRRAGVNITFGEMMDQLQKLKDEFGIFSKKSLVEGSAAFLNLNRDMGFTKEELFALQEAIATLAIVNGRAMDEVQKTVALALSSGYTEGLQRLGVSINRVTIAEKAAALGYADSYMALNELERAEATRILILEKTAIYQKDLLEYQKTLVGQIDKTNASVEDLNAATGKNLQVFTLIGAKLKEFWGWIKYSAVETSLFVDVINKLYDAISSLPENWDAVTVATKELVTANKELVNSFLQIGFSGLLSGAIENAEDYLDVIQNLIYPKVQKKPPEVISPEAAALSDEQLEAIEDAAKEMEELDRQAGIDRRDARTDLWRDLAKIERDGAQEVLEINQEYQEKLKDIADDAAEDSAKAVRKYDQDVKQAWDDYYNGVAEAQLKHNNKLLKIEEDYQEKLLRLREGFLLDLDDALHERDARQILTLIKRYNMEKSQAQRERDQNFKEEERSHKEHLALLDMQREERLKKLKEELDARLTEIRLQKGKELREAWEDHLAKLDQQKLEQKQRRDERLLDYKQELEDIRTHNQDRIDEIAQGLLDAGIATDTGMQGIYDVLETYIGSKGSLTQLWVTYAALMRAALTPPTIGSGGGSPYRDLTGGASSGSGSPDKTSRKSGAAPKWATGGIDIATTPKIAEFGDAGPEMAIFIPLRGGVGSISSGGTTQIPNIQSSGNGKGKVQIEVLLADNLEGRIVDKALGEVADIVFRRLR